tara:strand:+ start:12256 stop:12759 length:504 start_codon:yes stop_codon:yes gene_type:complete
MALKSDRYELQTDISFFCDTVLDRGVVVTYQGGTGTGAAMDQGAAVVAATAGVAGTSAVAGILLNDVVNKDLTRTHLNQHKDEVQKGGKVTVLRKGYVVTNAIENTSTPSVGDVAYLSDTVTSSSATDGSSELGFLTDTDGGAAVAVGRFLSAKDADGYAKVEVNLP